MSEPHNRGFVDGQQNEFDLAAAAPDRFYTPLISDVMDSMGLPSGVLDSSIRQIFFAPDQKVWGRAFPCRVVPTSEYVEIDMILKMVDHIPDQSIVVVAADADIDAALWGGLMSARARARGANGAVVNGGVRDIAQIREVDFPVFGTGTCVRDIRRRGYMDAYDVPVTIGSVTIHPGDLLFGDANGIVVIPWSDVASVFEKINNALAEESSTHRGLLEGGSAQELFRTFGRF